MPKSIQKKSPRDQALNVIRSLGREMRLIHDPLRAKWCCSLSRGAYKVLRDDSRGFIYERDYEKYVRVFDDRKPQMIIDMRIARELVDSNGRPLEQLVAHREKDNATFPPHIRPFDDL